MEFLFTAKQYSSAEAYNMGLVNGVAADSELDAMVAKITDAIGQNAPLTISLAKAAAREIETEDAARLNTRRALEFETTAQPASAKRGSISAAMAESKAAKMIFGAPSGVAGETFILETAAGIGVFSRHRAASA